MTEKKPNEGPQGGKEKKKKHPAQNTGFFGKGKDFGAKHGAMKHMRAKGHSKGR